MTLPDALPTLTAGAHDADTGEACVMEYVSVLSGEPWSDRPECTHPLLAHEARTANDLLGEHERARLVPLVGRLFGTRDDSPELRTRLRLTQARQVLRLVEPSMRPIVDVHVQRAERLLELTVPGDDFVEVEQAWDVARTLPARSGELGPAHESHHLTASRIMAFVRTPELGAAEAWALVALVAAHRLAAGECRADCGDERSRALRQVRDLDALLDVYDEVTGRVPDPLPPARLQELAAHL
ncbi:hypothetical protein ACHAAC_01015 [Aeromicrobium sp. CF4.19]|uniref:hypothetical protein n=1 Tax=Aeromicrobium sp. CF4.19 TaxID=3373082 RepID=UPI003EE58999